MTARDDTSSYIVAVVLAAMVATLVPMWGNLRFETGYEVCLVESGSKYDTVRK